VTPDRVNELIEAYGSDPARWPANERADAEALLRGDKALRARANAAFPLDRSIAAWARSPEAAEALADALAARVVANLPRQDARRRPWQLWGGGLGVAASVAAAAFLLTPREHTPTPQPHQVQLAAQAGSEQAKAEAFQLLFVPTPDEEDVL